MAAITWPSTLPQYVLTDGFKETLPDTTLRLNPDAGPALVRRRFTAGVTLIECAMLLTREELATFKTFFTSSLDGGALSFDWVHPVTREGVTMRFRQTPEFAPRGLDYVASLVLEVLP